MQTEIFWFRGNEEYGERLLEELGKRCNTVADVPPLAKNDMFIIYGWSDNVTHRSYSTNVKSFAADLVKVVGTELTIKDLAQEVPAEAIKTTTTVIDAPFYMVFVDGERNPTYQHPSIGLAKAEAIRLSKISNKKAYILAPISKMVPAVTVDEAPLDESDGELPF